MDKLETPDRRRAPRNRGSELVEVVFEDQQGNSIRTVALVEDLSEGGLCVSSSLPVSPGRIVRLHAEGLESRGVVRYCELGEYSYLWGLELTPGWRGDWRPHHELPLTTVDDNDAS